MIYANKMWSHDLVLKISKGKIIKIWIFCEKKVEDKSGGASVKLQIWLWTCLLTLRLFLTLWLCCLPLKQTWYTENQSEIPATSDLWLQLLIPTPDSNSWLPLLTPTPDSDSRLRLQTPTPDSRLRLQTPTPDSDSWLQLLQAACVRHAC